MTLPWILALLTLWVIVLLLVIVVLGLHRRRRAKGHAAASGRDRKRDARGICHGVLKVTSTPAATCSAHPQERVTPAPPCP